ncbi:MAG: hypothetical protein P3W87_002570 [Gammaproteobacteria bacterium]|nr:hypothetical protein [Gammaproteobacteria bacterium]
MRWFMRNTTILGLSAVAVASALLLLACQGGSADQQADRSLPPASAPLRGEYISRATFANPHAHIPAQCYIETSFGTQNACLFCHTDGVAKRGLGNNNPQAGLNPNIGNLQREYAFGVFDYPYVVNSSINPWLNTLKPEVLRQAVEDLGIDTKTWDMQSYIRQDNWRAAFIQRPGSAKHWDGGSNHPMRLFPGLSPDDLPADADGFVRTQVAERGFFHDGQGWITGWRAINFMPYGIFTPRSGSVSGIYIRLPQVFMQDEQGRFSLAVYAANLERVAANIQDRLQGETHYLGAANDIAIVRGQYPLGTEFAHPLHYVDVEADGTRPEISPFPGTRARRVKEIRWMYKMQPWYPEEFGMGLKDESAPIYAHRQQGWIDNGVGWLLGGWIEDKDGALRPQTPAELTQCVGCHSGNRRQSDVGQNAIYTSGTGNTIDSTWALPRKLKGEAGWREMDYLGYTAKAQAALDEAPGHLTRPEPRNRALGQGEFKVFLDYVVGASLYGDMPASMDAFLAKTIRKPQGYSADWPSLYPLLAKGQAEAVRSAQETRLKLMREFTARGAYKDGEGRILPELFLPTRREAREAAARYRQVVVTQRYDFGKDVFAETPFTFRYFRMPEVGFTHQDGRPYAIGEVITDRPIETDPAQLTFGMGITPTLIDESTPFAEGGTFLGDYVPLLD